MQRANSAAFKMKMFGFWLIFHCGFQHAVCTDFNNEHLEKYQPHPPISENRIIETSHRLLKIESLNEHSNVVISEFSGKDAELNPAANEFVPQKIFEAVCPSHLKLSDGNGNETTLGFDGDRGWALHFNTLNHCGYTNGELQFSFKGKITVRDSVVTGCSDVVFKYEALESKSDEASCFTEVEEHQFDLNALEVHKIKPYQTPSIDFNEKKIFTQEKFDDDELQSSALGVWILDAIHKFKCEKIRIQRRSPEVKLYQLSKHFSRTLRVFAADETLIEEFKMEPQKFGRNSMRYNTRAVKLYQMSKNFQKTHRVFAADKIQIEEFKLEIQKGVEKSVRYKVTKNTFGNSRAAKVKIPLFVLERELESVGNLKKTIDSCELKPVEIKNYLRICGFSGEINTNWKRKHLEKKLKQVLQEKCASLITKLDFPMEVDFGTNVYLTSEGNFLHKPVGGQNTLFDVDRVHVQLLFHDRYHELVRICDNKMIYCTILDQSKPGSNSETMLIISYQQIGEVRNPYLGDVNVVGGKPTDEIFVKIMGEWHKKKTGDVPYTGESCTRKGRKKSYESWKFTY